MTEAKVGFLYDIASRLVQTENKQTNTLLKSYYLMRCKELTKGYGLPEKHFSTKTRCPKCCVEWNSNTEIKVNQLKLSKRQRQRIHSSKSTKLKEKSKDLLISNEIEKICGFCKNSAKSKALKPREEKMKTVAAIDNSVGHVKENKPKQIEAKRKGSQSKTSVPEKKTKMNVYSNAFDVFSLQNKNNTLANTVKEQPKMIKNNKKKKDKFAGLCQKAVLASAKIKENKDKQNKLNLFLKPSST